MFASQGAKARTTAPADNASHEAARPRAACLQRRCGNQARLRLQAKLVVGPVDDPLEREADHIADQVVDRVMSASPVSQGGEGAPDVQREVEEPTPAESGPAPAAAPDAAASDDPLRAQIEQVLAQEGVQRQAEGESPAVGEGFESALSSAKGAGRPLPGGVRTEMESAFGADFSGVRMHTDGQAARMSRHVNAHAFTHGQDIFFSEGAFDLSSREGKHLLAHELTHTLQQGGDSIRRLTISPISFTSGACGGREVKWQFALDAAAPTDGYMVQHVKHLQTIEDCPSNVGSISTTPVAQFWEAWEIPAGATLWPHRAGIGYSDMSSRPPAPNKSGMQASLGKVKFFPRSVTGDLGSFGAPPASPNGGWGPGAVPTSGDLPSTATQPSWWSGAATEGPTHRWASSWWNCCGEPGSQFSRVDADPKP